VGGTRSVGQWVSSDACSRGNESLIMAPRQQPETNENQYKRFAQHNGSPRRGAPGRRRQKLAVDFLIIFYLTVFYFYVNIKLLNTLIFKVPHFPQNKRLFYQ